MLSINIVRYFDNSKVAETEIGILIPIQCTYLSDPKISDSYFSVMNVFVDNISLQSDHEANEVIV